LSPRTHTHRARGWCPPAITSRRVRTTRPPLPQPKIKDDNTSYRTACECRTFPDRSPRLGTRLSRKLPIRRRHAAEAADRRRIGCRGGWSTPSSGNRIVARTHAREGPREGAIPYPRERRLGRGGILILPRRATIARGGMVVFVVALLLGCSHPGGGGPGMPATVGPPFSFRSPWTGWIRPPCGIVECGQHRLALCKAKSCKPNHQFRRRRRRRSLVSWQTDEGMANDEERHHVCSFADCSTTIPPPPSGDATNGSGLKSLSGLVGEFHSAREEVARDFAPCL
jgi:hypothetical protein